MTRRERQINAERERRAKERKARSRAVQRAKVAARRERERLRRERRAAKRAARAAPKKNLVAWSRSVRAAGHCAVCGAVKFLQAHHLLPKERYPEFRLELLNGICLCPTCHKWGRYSFHRNTIWSTLWLRSNRPEQFQWCKANMGGDSMSLSVINAGRRDRPARPERRRL
jgi:5-methylcytosine-specific restriction endonuclease McrA